jgi:hypothetical protein
VIATLAYFTAGMLLYTKRRKDLPEAMVKYNEF